MSKILINSITNPSRKPFDGELYLSISEMFSETLQGEGVYIGHPATFIRLGGCHIGCIFCDSTAIWKKSQAFLFDEIFAILENSGTIARFEQGEHLIITGGAPMLQREKLLQFFEHFEQKFGFIPFIQMENECTIEPQKDFFKYISCWNNSPKLKNSQVPLSRRYKPRTIKKMSAIKNSWFKFVVSDENDWREIEINYLEPRLIKREQIILMPKGYSKAELEITRLPVAEMAMSKNVRFSDRLQITLYDTKISV